MRAKEAIYITSFIIVSSLLIFSLYLQLVKGFEPCPLCSLQRLAFLAIAIFFLLGVFMARLWFMRWLVNCALVLLTSLGLILAGRQIWLQHFPTQNDECGVSLHYMLQILPLNEVLSRVFQGSTECSQVGWMFLSLTMAEWSFISFLLFLLATLYLIKLEFGTKK